MVGQTTFDGSRYQHISHGTFYPTYDPNQKPLIANEFTLDMWVKIAPISQLGYLVSSGYGGHHALLFGIEGDGQKYRMTGNVRSLLSDGTLSGYSFSSDANITPNVWHLLSLELKNNVFTTYCDGVPQSKFPFNGQRIAASTEGDPGGGELFIGGSDHINFTGSIGQLRLVEGHGIYGGTGFIPEFVLNRSKRISGTNTVVEANLLADYTRCGVTVTDDSAGYRGKTHPGTPYSAIYGLGGWRYGSLPLPKCAKDNTYPAFADQLTTAPASLPESVPNNAVIFDSFNRSDSVMSGIANLGNVEFGNQTWANEYAMLGVQSDHAVYSGVYYYASALINGTANGTVSVDRVGSADTGVRFRSVDFNNGWSAFTLNGYLYIAKITNGAWSQTWQQPISTWTKLIVNTNGAEITVIAGSTIITVTDSTYQTATKAGIYAAFPTAIYKYDNFLITE